LVAIFPYNVGTYLPNDTVPQQMAIILTVSAVMTNLTVTIPIYQTITMSWVSTGYQLDDRGVAI
jgi:hypothetical protein